MSRSSSRRTTRPTTRCSRLPATSTRTKRARLVEEYFGPIPRGADEPPLPPTWTLPPTFGECATRDGRARRRHAAAALPRLPLAGVRQRRLLRRERHRRDSRNAARQPLYRTLVRERADRRRGARHSRTTWPKGSDLLVIDVTARPGVERRESGARVAREVDVCKLTA